jgi:hypothetical protein
MDAIKQLSSMRWHRVEAKTSINRWCLYWTKQKLALDQTEEHEHFLRGLANDFTRNQTAWKNKKLVLDQTEPYRDYCASRIEAATTKPQILTIPNKTYKKQKPWIASAKNLPFWKITH